MFIRDYIPSFIGGALILFFLCSSLLFSHASESDVLQTSEEVSYWFILHRKSQIEKLYRGVPGEKKNSTLVKSFNVKTGIAGKSPTPLPELLGRRYWLIVAKEDSSDNSETAPYFLQLDIDAPEEWPYGPMPYEECSGQCDWGKPGYFGLHGVGGDQSRLSVEDFGSSGCIRHHDEDITFLYNLLDPEHNEIRYYVEDN